MKNSTKFTAFIVASVLINLLLAACTGSPTTSTSSPSKAVVTAMARRIIRAHAVAPVQALERQMGGKVSKEKVVLGSVKCAPVKGGSVRKCTAKATIDDVASGHPAQYVTWGFRVAFVKGKWTQVRR